MLLCSELTLLLTVKNNFGKEEEKDNEKFKCGKWVNGFIRKCLGPLIILHCIVSIMIRRLIVILYKSNSSPKSHPTPVTTFKCLVNGERE